MKLAIIGKRNQMGTVPVIRMKGMSRLTYPFEWDKDERRYVYTPKNQREVEDICRTAGKLYKSMFFMPIMDEVEEIKDVEEVKEPEPEPESKYPLKRKSGKKAKKLQAVATI